MVNTGTVVIPELGLREGRGEIRGVRGQRLWAYRSSARAACESRDGCCSLRVSAVCVKCN